MKLKNIFSAAILPHLAIIGTVLFWGLSFVSSKTVLNIGVPPMTMAALRYLLASVILYPTLRIIEPGFKLPKKMHIPVAISGLIGISLYFYFEITGLQKTTVSNASMIIATIPIFTICIEYIFYNNKISWTKGIGILLSILGIYITIQQSQNEGSSSLSGNLLMLGACFCWVAYLVFTKGLQKSKITGLALTTYQCLYGALFLIPMALIEHPLWVPIPTIAWLNILYLALFCTAISFFFYVFALSHLGPVIISSYTNLIPLVGILGGILLMGDNVSLLKIVGGLVIITGVFIVNKKDKEFHVGNCDEAVSD